MNHYTKTLRLLTAIGCGCFLAVGTASGTAIFINEFHYDNAGGDTGEFIEIAAPVRSLMGWALVLYNGSSGSPYNTLSLDGIGATAATGSGISLFTMTGFSTGIQNGANDGIALIDPGNTVRQFLSYEGSLTALDGPAAGLTSMDIGVSESSATPSGYSLQLSGTGNLLEDFIWSAAGPATPGAINAAQTFVEPPKITVAEPATVALIGAGLLGIALARRRRDAHRRWSNGFARRF